MFEMFAQIPLPFIAMTVFLNTFVARTALKTSKVLYQDMMTIFACLLSACAAVYTLLAADDLTHAKSIVLLLLAGLLSAAWAFSFVNTDLVEKKRPSTIFLWYMCANIVVVFICAAHMEIV